MLEDLLINSASVEVNLRAKNAIFKLKYYHKKRRMEAIVINVNGWLRDRLMLQILVDVTEIS